jgi:signal transduction histidine kinase
MPLTLKDRFHPRLRSEQQAAIDAGDLLKCDEIALLEPENLPPLARLSLLMLIIGGLFFGGLNYVTYTLLMHANGIHIGIWGLIVWILINIIGYFVILPIHELLHGVAFMFWGGKPYYGTKLPFALYCGAKNQLFRRNQYLVIGLAPLVIITLAGIIFTLLFPGLASYTIFATIGNFSGAAGDVLGTAKLLHQSRSVLVEDTETGFRVWEITS